MLIAILILVVVHGAIHLIGFFGAFRKKPVQQLSQPVAKSYGWLWLAAAILFLGFALLMAMHTDYQWVVGFAAIALSQYLVVLWWKDARWGTIPNVLIFLVCLSMFGLYKFERMVSKEQRELMSNLPPGKPTLVTEQATDALPPPVKRWLQHSGVVGKPMITAGRMEQQLEMKLNSEDMQWIPAKATQYTMPETPAMLWWLDGRFYSFIRVQGRDKFADSRGSMLIKAMGVVPIVHEDGPKLDESTAQRLLGEMVWFPTMALSKHVVWQAVNDTTATATIRVGNTRGSGNFYFNAAGDCTRFTALRYMQNEKESKQYPWTIDVLGYRQFSGIRVPSSITVSWTIDDHFWTWLRLKVTDLRFNEAALK